MDYDLSTARQIVPTLEQNRGGPGDLEVDAESLDALPSEETKTRTRKARSRLLSGPLLPPFRSLQLQDSTPTTSVKRLRIKKDNAESPSIPRSKKIKTKLQTAPDQVTRIAQLQESGKLGPVEHRSLRVAYAITSSKRPKPQEIILQRRSSSATNNEDREAEGSGDLPGLEPFDRLWTETISRLKSVLDERMGRIVRGVEDPLVTPDTRLLERLPAKASIVSMRALWKDIDMETRHKQWPLLMLWHLQHRIDAALDFLVATLIEPLPSAYQLAGVFDYLVCIGAKLQDWDQFSKPGLAKISRAMHVAMGRYVMPLPILQRTIYNLMINMEAVDSRSFFETLLARKVTIKYNTYMQFASRFAHFNEHELALECLTRAIHMGADTTSESFINVCSTLLRQSADLSRQGQSPHAHRIILVLSRLGVTLRRKMYNVLITNAIDSKQLKTAWKLYDLLCFNEEGPDHVTHKVLLKSCRLNNDKARFRKIYARIRGAQQGGNGDLHPVVVAELLCCFYYFGHRKDFYPPLHFYAKHCALQPLVDLKVLDQEYADHLRLLYHPSSQRPKPPPSPPTLSLILHIFIRCSDSVKAVAQVYRTFKERLSQRDPVCIPVAAEPMLWTSFLTFFCLRKHLLDMWPVILQDMARPFRPATPFTMPSVATPNAVLIGDSSNKPPANEQTPPSQVESVLEGETYLRRPRHLYPEGKSRIPPVGAILRRHYPERWASYSGPSSQPRHPSLPGPSMDTSWQSATRLPTTPVTGAGEPDQLPINPQTGARFTPCRPTAVTWSVVMRSFACMGHDAAAEKIAQRMEAQGMELTQVMWNGLLEGYSRAEREDKVVEVLKRMQEKGVAWDEGTMRAVRQDNPLTRREKPTTRMRHERINRIRAERAAATKNATTTF